MYQEFFSLNQQPFSIAPDPEFIFFTEQHKEALAHLKYGLQGNGGFVVLTGEIGTGKTSICRFLLQDMPTDTDIASITNPAVSEIALLVDICEQFSISYNREKTTLKMMFDTLASWMLVNHQRGRHAIVLIDEAQHLSFNVLEQLRLITNIESDNLKPLQIILVGQTALQEKLQTTELRQLSQRITARYHLQALNKQETNFYIYHRLNTSGAKGTIFDPKSVSYIFKASLGIPRLINQICDRCLLSAFTQSSLIITPSIAKRVIDETELPKRKSRLKTYTPHFIILIAVMLIVFIIKTQSTTIVSYFDDSNEEIMEQEWLTIINSAKSEVPSTAKDLATSAEVFVTTTLEVAQKTSGKLATTITSPITTSETSTIAIEKQPVYLIELTPTKLLQAIPSSNYSLQLAALNNENSVIDFFEEYPQLHKQSYLYKKADTTNSKYVVLLGSFETYKMAKLASTELVNIFPKISPWIKDYKRIHRDLQ